MRTKTLLCAAVLAAGVASTMAQSNVYSLNVVGYYNVPLAAGQFKLVANQFNTTNNTIASIFASGPPGAIFQKYNGGFTAYIFDDIDNVWTPDGLATLNPGEGGFFKSPVNTTLTFVGEVPQGSLTNGLSPKGVFLIRSSKVPQAGLISTDLKLPGEGGDILQTYAGGFTAFLFDDIDNVWTPSEPNLGVGASFFFKKSVVGTQTNWIRNFTVQ